MLPKSPQALRNGWGNPSESAPDIASRVQPQCIQNGSSKIGGHQSGHHCTVCREDLDASAQAISRHLESWNHTQHVAWVEEGCNISFGKRKLLIENRYTFRDGWFNCTLCSKRSIDYDSSLPHIECDKHKKKLRSVSHEDAIPRDTGYDVIDAPAPEKIQPIIRHLRDCSTNLAALVSAMNSPDNLFVNAEEMKEIRNGMGELALLAEHATERMKFLREVVSIAPSQSRLGDGRTCLLCFQRERSKYFLPCKHFVLCNECLRCLTPKLCPICREVIVESHDVIAS